MTLAAIEAWSYARVECGVRDDQLRFDTAASRTTTPGESHFFLPYVSASTPHRYNPNAGLPVTTFSAATSNRPSFRQTADARPPFWAACVRFCRGSWSSLRWGGVGSPSFFVWPRWHPQALPPDAIRDKYGKANAKVPIRALPSSRQRAYFDDRGAEGHELGLPLPQLGLALDVGHVVATKRILQPANPDLRSLHRGQQAPMD